MHRISSYVARGREFESETIESLMSRLLELLQGPLSPDGRPGLEMINDIEAELDPRHVQRPFAVGQKEIEKIRLATLAFAEKLDDGSRLTKEAELVERNRSARKTIS
jgi:hypothetical protein